MTLRVSDSFGFPDSAVTEVISLLATRGAGKSFASAVVVEELQALGLQFCVIDPMGVYWGLRLAGDGKAEGLPIVVFGGERGDVPLEPTSGRLIADVLVDSGQSFVLDLSLFDSKAEQVRFMEAFCERLFYRKGPIESRTPIMLVVDEADEFAPQKPEKNETKMLGHMIRLAKRGRTRGIGLLSLTQRSADFSKAVLDLSSAVGFMRTLGPRDRKAIKDWIRGSADPALEALVDTEFPKLKTGEVLLYSPHWLGLEAPERTKFRLIDTYDSYRTPEPGEVLAMPRPLEAIDLDALGAQIAATVERAKENDPATLRKRIADLERQLTDLPVVTVPAEPVIERVEVPVLSDKDRDLLEIVGVAAAEFNEQGAHLAGLCADLIGRVEAGVERPVPPPTPPPPPPKALPPPPPPRDRLRLPAVEPTNGDTGLSRRAERMVLGVLAQYPQGRSKVQTAILAGYSSKGGGFNNALRQLRKLGYMEGSDTLTITSAGLHAIEGKWEPLPTGEALLEHWLGSMGRRAEREVLLAIVNAYPRSISKEAVAEAAGYEATGGGFNNALRKLRQLELVEGTTELRAADALAA